MILLISALKVVLALLFPCHLLLVQEQVFVCPSALRYSHLFATPVVNNKYDCDYPSDDITCQTLPKLFAEKHFLTSSVDVCKVCT